MKSWLKENWFKLAILCILITFVLGFLTYLDQKNKFAEQERLNVISKDNQEKIIAEQAKISSEKSVATKNAQIVSQLVMFEDVLEGKIIDADINCSVLANYNNVLKYGGTDIETAFPESPEVYKNKCLSSSLQVSLVRNKLIAELELQTLRKILTEYIDLVRRFASYASDGGYSAQIINEYSNDLDKYRLNAREELLRLQRKYNVKAQYVNQI